MFSRVAITFASVFMAFATAQSSTSAATNSTPTSFPGTTGFNIGNVSSTDLFNWCHAQQISCPQMCGGSASANTCDSTTLDFSCVCSNGTVPDVAAYTFTVPFFVCQATYGQCVNAHPNDAQGQQTCKDAEKCGSINATTNEQASAASTSAAASTVSTATASSTASGSATGGSGSSSATASSSSSSASAKSFAAKMTPEVGMSIFAALFLALFKLVL